MHYGDFTFNIFTLVVYERIYFPYAELAIFHISSWKKYYSGLYHNNICILK